MISKAKISLIRSLEQKKFRQQEQLYVAEGLRIVSEAILHAREQLVEVLATTAWIEQHTEYVRLCDGIVTEISPKELERISLLHTPNEVVALLRPKPETAIALERGKFYLALERIQDPGNMGTLLRIADWFGFSGVFCSSDSVDVYNPKVVQSAMGSLFRVPLQYGDLSALLRSNAAHSEGLPSWATVVGGENLWALDKEETAATGGILLIGNEGGGLSEDLVDLCSHRIGIPSYGGAESLNAAVATAVCALVLRKHSR